MFGEKQILLWETFKVKTMLEHKEQGVHQPWGYKATWERLRLSIEDLSGQQHRVPHTRHCPHRPVSQGVSVHHTGIALHFACNTNVHQHLHAAPTTPQVHGHISPLNHYSQLGDTQTLPPPTTLGSLPHPTLTFSCQGGAKPSIGAWRVLQDLRCGAHCIHCIPSPSQDFNSLNSITVI